MKYLITGGAGLLGSNLSKKLLQQGHKVTILDNFSTGCKENIAPLLECYPKWCLNVVGSVTDGYIVNQLVKSCDTVIHFASVVGVYNVTNNSVKAIESNVIGDQNVLTAASMYNKGIIIASTSEIFGRSTDEIAKETNDVHIGNPYNSRWSYAAVKAINEWLVMGYHKEQNLPVMIFRFFNVAGPNQSMKSGLVLPMMIKNALQGTPIEIFGNGRQVRCFMHVDDATNIMWSLLDGLQRHSDHAGEIFNIGNPHNEIAIADLAGLVIELIGSKSEIIFRKYEDAYPTGFQELNRRVPDMTKTMAACRLHDVYEGFEGELAQNIGAIISDMTTQIRSRVRIGVTE